MKLAEKGDLVANMNEFKFTLARLTRDPEVRYTPTQVAICNLLLAVDRYVKGEKKTDFPRVTVFGKDAENLATYSGKGLRVNVFGRIETGSYKKGEDTIYTNNLICERLEIVDFKDKGIKVDYKESSDPVPEFNGVDADIPF